MKNSGTLTREAEFRTLAISQVMGLTPVSYTHLTTILSSTGAQCDHIKHVSTQLPYAITVAACCFVGYLVAGISGGNVYITLGVSLALLIGAILILHRISKKRGVAL